MPEQKQIIMFYSPDAASLKTVTGWVSADGRFFGRDENLARFCGATHRICKNNPDHPVHQVRGYCEPCHKDKRDKAFADMPVKEWDGESLVDFDGDRYFFDAGCLRDYLIDEALILPICGCASANRTCLVRSIHRTFSARICRKTARSAMTNWWLRSICSTK